MKAMYWPLPALDAAVASFNQKYCDPHYRDMLLVRLRDAFSRVELIAPGTRVRNTKCPDARAAVDRKRGVLFIPLGMAAVRISPHQVRLYSAEPTNSTLVRYEIRVRAFKTQSVYVAVAAIGRAACRVDRDRFFHQPIEEGARLAACAIEADSDLPALPNVLCGSPSSRERLAMIARWPLVAEWEPEVSS